MRRIAFISCVVLAVIVASAQQYNVPFRPRAAAGGGGIEFVQATTNVDSFGAPYVASVSLPAITLTAGNGVVVLVNVAGNQCASNVTASDGANTYTQVIQIFDSGQSQCGALFYAEIVTGGSRTIVVAHDGTQQWFAASAVEYSGVAAGAYATVSDATAVASTATGTTWTTATITTGTDGSLIVAGVAANDGSAATNDESGGATERVDTAPLVFEDKTTTTAGANTITGTKSSSTSHAILALAIKKL